MEQSFFLRSAAAGLSAMVRTSLAWTTRTRWSRKPRAGRAAWISASVADQVKGGDSRVGLQRPLGALDDDPAAVVATHDIHCDSHNRTERGEEPRPAPGSGQAPAVTVRTWRPL